jgi:hypothetical protein
MKCKERNQFFAAPTLSPKMGCRSLLVGIRLNSISISIQYHRQYHRLFNKKRSVLLLAGFYPEIVIGN